MRRRTRRASSADVARLAGVSRTTVSFVLNNAPGKLIPEKTRQSVLRAARRLRYTPDEKARSSAMIRHHSIGFFIPHSGYVSSDAYVARLVEGMVPQLNKARMRLVLQPLALTQENYLQLAREDGVDGIILTNTHDDDHGLSSLIEAGFPLVVIGTVSRPGVCQIDIDNRAAASAAVRALLSLGHRDLGMIPHAPLAYYAARERYLGFQEALQAAGVPEREEWVREANLTEESGREAMQRILGSSRTPTAVFAGNDVVAYGALRAIRDAGLSVPGDISLMGFDDDLVSRYLNPSLSTVTNPAPGMGAEAARLLISILRGRTARSARTVLPTSVAMRESCQVLQG